jgi:hypothetical protein
MKIKHIINSSFQSAKNKKLEAGSKRELHNERSKAWVEYLTNSLRETFPNDTTIRIFSNIMIQTERILGSVNSYTT